jgi:hypothetical protein
MISPEAVVQRQLDAYNARDIDALIAIYAADAQMFEHPAKLLAKGSTALRERFLVRFKEPNLHAQLLKRVVMGNIKRQNSECVGYCGCNQARRRRDLTRPEYERA